MVTLKVLTDIISFNNLITYYYKSSMICFNCIRYLYINGVLIVSAVLLGYY